MHPGLDQPVRHQYQQPNCKKYRQNSGGPCDDVPQPFFHNFKLGSQYIGFIFWFQCPLYMIDKEPGHVKQSCKPGDDKNKM